MTVLSRVARCSHGDLPATIGRLFGEIIASNPNDEAVAPPLVRYLSWAQSECEIETALPVEPDTVAGDGNRLRQLPGCSAVRLVHIGPYEGLAETWARFWSAVLAEGILCDAPAWDWYVTDPGHELDPTKWETELYIPLRRVI